MGFGSSATLTPGSVAGADTDPAAALPTAPGGSAAAPGAEENPTGPKGPGQKVEPGGKAVPWVKPVLFLL